MPDEREDIIEEKDEIVNGEETDGESLAQPVELSPDLIAELQKKADERDDFLDKLQRTRADYLNFQKRVKKDRKQASEFAVQDFVTQLVPLINDLDRAVQAGEESHNMDAFFEGVKLLRTQLYKVLEDNGIKPIECVGRSFDPAYHEAMTQQETDEYPDNTVIAELQRGFTMSGRTIVPARVIVAKAPKQKTDPAEEGGDEEISDKNDSPVG
ncbi:MAG: nucleotide exchange factor GrpE [Planctomycetes bacterium]|nr:nucleotide exchange factor GrpE [Planctomycetota bacterium]